MTRIVCATGDEIVRLEPDGAGWRAESLLERPGAACVAADPHDPDRLLAGTRGSGCFASTDGGRTWEGVELPESDVYSVAVSAADGAAYAGTEPSRLFRAPGVGGSFVELDALQQVPSRDSWSFPPRPWTSHVRWIAPEPARARRLLVGIELGGVMRTDDGGESFSDRRPGAQLDCHELAWHPVVEGRAYEAGGGGAAWSLDGGETWDAADAGREVNYCWALAVDPDDPERWFVSAASGPRAAHGSGPAGARLYRWEGEGPWRALDDGLASPLDAMPYALACFSGSVWAGMSDGRLLRADRRGEGWEELPVRLARVMAMVVVG